MTKKKNLKEFKGFGKPPEVNPPGKNGYFRVVSVDKNDSSVELEALNMPQSMRAKNSEEVFSKAALHSMGFPMGRGNICWAKTDAALEVGSIIHGEFEFHPSKSLKKRRMPKIMISEIA